MMKDIYLCCLAVLIIVAWQVLPSVCLPPAYLPFQREILEHLSTDDLITGYFEIGFSYLEITMALSCLHNIIISVRHLKRKLKALGLRRRPVGNNISQLDDVLMAMLLEMKTSGICRGYRAIWRRLVLDRGLCVGRDFVLNAMRVIDPDGIAMRKAHRLQRRQYRCPGPDFIWHMDGYDKLKPFGFAVHGCIDGFSRRIIWLRVAKSNNNPAIVASYYLDAVKQLSTVPMYLRSDFGTDNTTTRLLQIFFNRNDADPDAGFKSFIYGKNTSNQRIEAWCALMRKHGIHWWINLFKDLRDFHIYQDANPIHVECLKFCFMTVIQEELNDVARHWNLHIISKSRLSELPSGKPDVMYFMPEIHFSRRFGRNIRGEDIDICRDLYGTNAHELPCSQEFIELVHVLKPTVNIPKTPTSALDLYLELTNTISQYE